MNWIKISVFGVAYTFIVTAIWPLFVSFFNSITQFNSVVTLNGELGNITNLIVEGAMTSIFVGLFLLPIGGRDGRLNSSIDYFAASFAEGIDSFFNGSYQTLDGDAKTKKYLSLAYNFLLLAAVTMLYFFLIRIGAGFTNGLEYLCYGFIVWGIVTIINFLTSILYNIDAAAKEDEQMLSKKNVITLIIMVSLILVLSFGPVLTKTIYNGIHNVPLINVFDGSRTYSGGGTGGSSGTITDTTLS